MKYVAKLLTMKGIKPFLNLTWGRVSMRVQAKLLMLLLSCNAMQEYQPLNHIGITTFLVCINFIVIWNTKLTYSWLWLIIHASSMLAFLIFCDREQHLLSVQWTVARTSLVIVWLVIVLVTEASKNPVSLVSCPSSHKLQHHCSVGTLKSIQFSVKGQRLYTKNVLLCQIVEMSRFVLQSIQKNCDPLETIHKQFQGEGPDGKNKKQKIVKIFGRSLKT